MGKNQLSPEQNAKIKRNLLWIFIFAVIMIFAGLTSGYIVSRGTTFWVAIQLPSGFLSSTISIIASSGLLFLAAYAIKQEKHSLRNFSLGAALVGGILFGLFQFQGFKQLFNSGNAVSGPIMENNGRYGNIFTLSYEGKIITYENNVFYWKGAPVSEELHQKIRDFGAELEEKSRYGKQDYDFDNYGSGLMLYYLNDPLTFSNGKLYIEDSELTRAQLREAYEFGENLASDRGDFIMDGTYGEDFYIYYDGKKLDYENRIFYMDGQRLSPKLENQLYGAANTSSSYIYAITFVHLMHWLGGVIALLVVFIRGLQNKYTATNYLGLRLGSTYWHFLGILWIYLYAFLIFIH